MKKYLRFLVWAILINSIYINQWHSITSKNNKIILKGTGSDLKKIISNLPKNIQENIDIIFDSNIDINIEDFNLLIKNLKIYKGKISINLKNLSPVENEEIFMAVIENLELFSIIDFPILDENSSIRDSLDQMIGKLNLVVRSTKDKIINGKLNEVYTLYNKDKQLTIIVNIEKKFERNRNPDPFEQIFNITNDFSIIENSMPTQRNNTDKDPVMIRAKTLLKSEELDIDVKNKIKNLIEKIESRGMNPNNETEKIKDLDILKIIVDIFILKKEDEANLNIINQLKNAYNPQNSQEFFNILKQLEIKLWSVLEPADSAKEIVDHLIRFIENLAIRKKNKNNSQNEPRLSLLLYGEPGLGKTTIPKQFAEISGLPVIILNAGDEKKYFVGNLKTYVNSDAGAIAKGLQNKAGGNLIEKKKASKNMIFIIDEVDKYSKEAQESLLSLLDSSQKFFDQHLELPIPIEDCIFILTANDISKVSEPLKDRCSQTIKVKHLSFKNKRNILKKTLIDSLKRNYPDKQLEISNKVLNIIVKKSSGLGGRQIKINGQNLINYITNHLINDNSKKIVITEEIVRKALSSYDGYLSPIKPDESKVGYVNGIINNKTIENYNKEVKNHIITNIACVASNEFNNQHVIVPIDYNLQSVLQGLSKSATLLLNTMSLSNKNVSINIKETNISIEENRSLISLLLVSWVSAVSNKKVKSQSTIIADALPNNDLEYDSKTINKIQMAYNYGLRKIVIANIKPSLEEQSESNYSQEFLHLIKIFNLKLKTNKDNVQIYYHDYQSAEEDAMYPDLEICVVENMREALDYLLIN